MKPLLIQNSVFIKLPDDKIKLFLQNASSFETVKHFEIETDSSKFFPANLNTEEWENVLLSFNKALEGELLNETQIKVENFPVTFRIFISKIPKVEVLKSTILCDLIYTIVRLVLNEYDSKNLNAELTEKKMNLFRMDYYYSASILIGLLANVENGSISNESATKINDILLECIYYNNSINFKINTGENKVSEVLSRIVGRFILLFSKPDFKKKFESNGTGKKGISLLSLVESLIKIEANFEKKNALADAILLANKRNLNFVAENLKIQAREEVKKLQPRVAEDKSIAGYLITGRADVFLLLASWLGGLKK